MTETHPSTTRFPPEKFVDESCYRVRIFPSPSSWSSSCNTPPPPPPPSSLPPKPSHLCKIAVVGDARVGKTSIVQKFIRRQYVVVNHPQFQHDTINITGIDESGMKEDDLNTSSPTNNPNTNTTGGAATSSSMGTSSFQSGGRYHHHHGGGGWYGSEQGGEQQPSSWAEYYKKDITLLSECNCETPPHTHHVVGTTSSLPPQQTAQHPICIRVQCWDMNIPPQLLSHSAPSTPQALIPPMMMNEVDSYSSFNTQSVHSNFPTPITYNNEYNSSSNNNNNNNNSSISESLLQLIKRVDGILIVCRCPLPPATTTIITNASSSNQTYYYANSSNASNVSHTTDDVSSSAVGGGGGAAAAVGSWPELETLHKTIQAYTSFLVNNFNHDQQQQQQQQENEHWQEKRGRRVQPAVFVLLSCADLAAGEYSPRQYVKLSNRMDEICNQCGVASWRMGTCMNNTRNEDGCSSYSTMETIISTTTTNTSQQRRTSLTLLNRMMKQQLLLMEDMEDAIEGIFMDMISQVLVGKRDEKRSNW
jgi:hypothetical protein